MGVFLLFGGFGRRKTNPIKANFIVQCLAITKSPRGENWEIGLSFFPLLLAQPVLEVFG